MKTTKNLLVAAAVTGALAAMPLTSYAGSASPFTGPTADKLGCGGKEGCGGKDNSKDKNKQGKSKDKSKDKDKDKNACSGKDGCSGKDQQR